MSLSLVLPILGSYYDVGLNNDDNDFFLIKPLMKITDFMAFFSSTSTIGPLIKETLGLPSADMKLAKT